MQRCVLTGTSLPVGLADLADPPQLLYCVGELPPVPWVAVVGTRGASDAAVSFARELAASLCGAGVTVASGGARGIDAAAHEGALDVGGRTVVVAPSGYLRPSPSDHAELFRRIVDGGGAHLSPFEDDHVARRHTFFLRNAVLVACSALVVVVESPLRSGARNAASVARKCGRPLFVVPHPPWHRRGLGCIEELRLGAQPLSSVKQILRVLEQRGFAGVLGRELGGSGNPPQQIALPGLVERRALRASTQPACTADVEGRVAAALQKGTWTHLEQLVAISGVSVGEVQRLLVSWSLSGRVEVADDGSVRPL